MNCFQEDSFRSDPDADIIVKIIFQGQLLKVLKAAQRFGVFEILEASSENGVTTELFVKEHEFDFDNIRTMLECLCYLKLVKRDKNEKGQWVFRNTAASSKYFIQDRTPTFIPLILQDDMIAIRKQRPDEGLFHSHQTPEVREKEGDSSGEGKMVPSGITKDTQKETTSGPTNGPTNGHALGGDMTKKHWNQTEVMKMVMLAMDCCLATCLPALINAFDLSGHKVAVDLGGGAGRFAISLSETYPQMDVSVFDKTPICQFSQRFWGEKSKKINYISGDFFMDDLPEADLYILGHILHDWNIKLKRLLVEKVYKALAKGGSILVLEKLLDTDELKPEIVVTLNAMITSNTLGLETTEPEYADILHHAGFTDIRAKRLPGYNFYDAIIAKKPF